MATEKDAATAVRDTAAAAKDVTRRTSGETRDAAQEFGRMGRQATDQTAQTAQDLADAGKDTTGKVVDVSGQLAQGSAESAQRVLEGAAQASKDMSVQVSRNMDALMSAQGVMAEGMQSVWREWLRYSQESMQRWADQTQALLRVRSLQDLVSTQSDILRIEMEQLMKSSQRISELATHTANDAANRVIRRGEEQQDDVRRSA